MSSVDPLEQGRPGPLVSGGGIHEEHLVRQLCSHDRAADRDGNVCSIGPAERSWFRDRRSRGKFRQPTVRTGHQHRDGKPER
ncbi:hypothetical protein [Bradyrhizobium sp. USDA 4353]